MSPNALADANSAYLRQHAHNPVDWYEWGDDAFRSARELDRPIFLSIGYAACHWCHVMAHESFEDQATADDLNGSFVAIKVDREERPDVDALYMAAAKAVSGHGGWPLSIFLTPEGQPFMAGTYYPPEPRHGQPSFRQLLSALATAWRGQRAEVYAQASELARAVQRETRFLDQLTPTPPQQSWRQVNATLVDELLARLDPKGGFGGAPKFPRPSYVESLLVRWDLPAARDAVTLTLEAMSRQGLYDHVGGGFARYSVDDEWHVPHFEKMLSDQALIALAYLRAHRARGDDSPWRDVALDALRFVVRDLAVLDGFASSLDADSNGEEGAHVTFTAAEVRDALAKVGRSDLADATLARWRIDDVGEFEGRSIPRLAPGEPFVTPEALGPALATLRDARAARPAPGRDDKVVLEWNAMFVVAALESGDGELKSVATDLLRRLSDTHSSPDGWWRTSSRRARATAADVSWLIEAHLTAFETDGHDSWLEPVDALVTYLLDQFWDGEVPDATHPDVGGGIFTSARDVTDLITRPKEIFDGATPSGHAVACTALARWALLTGDARADAVANRLINLAGSLLSNHPTAVPDLVRAFGYVQDGREIVIPGDTNDLTNLVRCSFVPSSVLVTGTGSLSLLRDRATGWAYLCRQQSCALPATSRQELAEQLTALRLGSS